MAEQLCAYFGTNNMIEVIVLRSAPANKNEEQYPDSFNWEENNKEGNWKRGAFWANNTPQNVANAVYLAVKSDKKFIYEPFNVANKFTDKKVDVKRFLEMEYPNVELKIDLTNNPCLIDTRKIEKILGFKSVDNRSKIKKFLDEKLKYFKS